MSDARSLFALGEDFWAAFGHQDGVFKLGGKLAVLGPDRPFVFDIEFGESRSDVNHRFDGEAHAW